ncbi:Cell fate regulator YlbF, YheA/YmcA/DUF963 family (controls sporulation, competence, biofilm development) [Desulfonispora thiosulfatigenes DSM 11270]|uniref:Cell fate regulator YlbF, YheA/YmcA/DUF963 family (Controls sporulation, competence, biofilm development) n=1 Tax=Desulfonispora thiosulfatigenes DSM 11270 TaxID=656914 RepID=A0A1W1VPA7_DESTI|nr:YlbF family regulator [Desulfonispora thiosulfatigenes]SMB95070.1 Cell fate regulator YlbF, YheA/YmcA/DUF963 family (controls sporulation, competence, biofilm development) [Desulfonispora thiosulfatigenes DSM 11270]
MQILDKAKELADAIRNSEELKAVREGEMAISADPEAQKIIEEYQNLQKEVHTQGLQELTAELKEQADSIEEKMSKNQTLVDYLGAQEKLDNILGQLNNMINNALTQQNEEGCTSCSSCCGSCS